KTFEDRHVETDASPQQVERRIDSADLVVGLLAEFDKQIVANIYDALRSVPEPLRIAVVESDQSETKPPENAEGAEKGASPEEVQNKAAVFSVPLSWTKPEGNATGVSRMSAAYRAVFEVAEKFRARGCCIIASRVESAAPGRAWELAQPVFQGEVDLVLP